MDAVEKARAEAEAQAREEAERIAREQTAAKEREHGASHLLIFSLHESPPPCEALTLQCWWSSHLSRSLPLPNRALSIGAGHTHSHSLVHTHTFAIEQLRKRPR